MNSKEYVSQVVELLSAYANPTQALEMKAYLRNKFEFLGIQTPVRRQLCKDLPKLPKESSLIIDIANKLWKKEEREYRYVACDLLVKNANLFCLDDLPIFKRLLQTDSWWETVDTLSGAIGDIVLKEFELGKSSQEVMDKWLMDKDYWVRRSAMIHQLGWRMKTDINRLERYSLVLASEKEFFIRKAIGWAFRDYAKSNPKFVSQFFKKNAKHFSGLTIREATKNLIK